MMKRFATKISPLKGYHQPSYDKFIIQALTRFCPYANGQPGSK